MTQEHKQPRISAESRPELMAPAGGPDSGYAALHYGADAVYLGLQQFSARAEAVNFTMAEVDELTAYAHSLKPKRRVYAAVNTLILQDELKDLVKLIGSLQDIGIDALIIQDLGAYWIVKKHFPGLRLHASTQMAVHNRAGVETLRQLGFARVTLARELTLEEIREIAAMPGIETEVFIHGALCYSYSGLCLFSSFMLGRSGNRGQCAYLCRNRFKEAHGHSTGFNFSMKDLAEPDFISDLRQAGIASFKIEGRMKSPLYVAATTQFYRELIDGPVPPNERQRMEADIQTIFSRPWTSLYLASRRAGSVTDPEFIGHRGLPIGTAEKVISSKSGEDWLRFTSRRALERHDGLQIDIPGLDQPFGFPVDKLQIISGAAGQKKQTVFEAPADSSVEVLLPSDHPYIPAGSTLYCSSSQDVKRRYPFFRPKPGQFRSRQTIDVILDLDRETLRARLQAIPRQADEPRLEIQGKLPGPFEKAKSSGNMPAAVRGSFEKLGDTRLALHRFTFNNPEDVFVPVSKLNTFRRELTREVEMQLQSAHTIRMEKIQSAVKAACDPVRAPSHSTPDKFRWSIKTDRIALLAAFEADDWRDVDEVIVEVANDPIVPFVEQLERLARQAGRESIRLALPLIVRKWEEQALAEQIGKLRQGGWNKWEIPNLGGWALLGYPIAGRTSKNEKALMLSTDWSIYVTNGAAARQILEMGARRFVLSPEDSFENIRKLLAAFGPEATVIVYQDTPLFVSETSVYADISKDVPRPDGSSADPVEMESSHGDRILMIQKNGRTFVLGKKPFSLAGHLPSLADAGAASLRVDFMYRPYDPAKVRTLWRQWRSGTVATSGHSANFNRTMR